MDEDADADAQRFVADEVVEESPPARIGTRFGVWAVSAVCGNDTGMGGGHQGLGIGSVPVKMMMGRIADAGGVCARHRCAGTGLSRL